MYDPFKRFDKDWALVTAGTKEDFNTMTVSWGSLGTLWSRPIVTVYVKKCRYTYEYMNDSDYFTVSFYDEKYRKDLTVLGTKSKRDCDKLALTDLHPEYLDKAITFKEAELTYVCKKIYMQDFDTDAMPEDIREHYYSKEPVHRMYIGEVVDIIER